MYVLHFRDGSTSRFTSPPTIDYDAMVVRTTDPVTAAGFSELKAVFFVTDARRELDDEQPAGSFLVVEFEDGEVIRGVALYNPAAPGFFLHPAEKGKNEMLFVVASAVVSVSIEKV